MACRIDKKSLDLANIEDLIRLAKFLGVAEETIERCEKPLLNQEGVEQKYRNNLIHSILRMSGNLRVGIY